MADLLEGQLVDDERWIHTGLADREFLIRRSTGEDQLHEEQRYVERRQLAIWRDQLETELAWYRNGWLGPMVCRLFDQYWTGCLETLDELFCLDRASNPRPQPMSDQPPSVRSTPSFTPGRRQTSTILTQSSSGQPLGNRQDAHARAGADWRGWSRDDYLMMLHASVKPRKLYRSLLQQAFKDFAASIVGAFGEAFAVHSADHGARLASVQRHTEAWLTGQLGSAQAAAGWKKELFALVAGAAELYPGRAPDLVSKSLAQETAQALTVVTARLNEPRVAIGFSGGGMRAASQGLGVLRHLQRRTERGLGGGGITQLDHMSSVSGGGYTGTGYAAFCSFGRHQAGASIRDGACGASMLC